MKQLIAIGATGVLLGACHPNQVTPPLQDTAAGTITENSGTSKELKSIDVSYIDKNVKPQEDFFLFSNGVWCKENPVPNSESRWGSFNELDQRNKVVLKEILLTAQKAQNTKGSDSQLLGDYYTAYTDMATRNKLGYNAIKEKVTKIEGAKSRENVVKLLAEQHSYGIRSLFGFGVDQDLKNVNGHISSIGQSGLGLPNKDFYFKENKAEIRTKYQDYIKTIFVLSGETEAKSAEAAKVILEFETDMASAMMSPEELRVPENTYNKKSMAEFKKMIPNMDVDMYLTAVGSQSFDTIVVEQPAYITKVNEMFANVSMDKWITYLKWKTLNHYAGALSDEWVAANFDFYQKTMSGKKEMKPIDERAIDHLTGSTLGELLGKAFVEKTFSASARARVNTMVDNLLAAYRTRINSLDWMSETTKKEALVKLNAIGRKLVCPEVWTDLSSIVISPTAYIENLDNVAKYNKKDNFSRLYKAVDKNEWGMPAHMVNAYYNPLLNEIAFPAGIMQPPFFDENAEDAVNYGRIGMVIGHEFTHGFDDSGAKFAADGSFTNWWQEADKTLFEERTKILGETFEHFCPIDGHCVNPNLTMGENIADLGGLTMAYYAYSMTDEFKSGKKIEGYTPAQRFFIAYAQLWKINYTEAEMKNRIATDPHSPGMYRVNGPLMNCPEFFEAFGVKEGDKMRNPADKIAKIW